MKAAPPQPAILLRTVFILVLAATAGALAGAASSFYVSPVSYMVVEPAPPVKAPPTAPTSTVSEPSLVRLEPRLVEPLLPPGFLTRRSSPVATIYRKAKGTTPEERTLTDERMLGQAVALTSDGWFVTVASAIGSIPLSELTVWHDGSAYSVMRGMTDRVNGTAYLKVQSAELPSPAFGDVLDLVPGSEIWMERRGRSFAPTLVTSLVDRMGSNDAASSENASRRIALDGTSTKGDIGSPAWNSAGALVGLIESAAGEPSRIIPASSISASFSSLLSAGAIQHAVLGVRSIDLSNWRIDGDRGSLPLRGALLHDDRKSGKPAIVKDSPAAKAGLKAGDVILSFERDILDGTRDIGEVLADYRPGARVTLRVNRGGTETDILVTLGTAVTGESLK